jgi:hypothetical protein
MDRRLDTSDARGHPRPADMGAGIDKLTTGRERQSVRRLCDRTVQAAGPSRAASRHCCNRTVRTWR